MLVTGQFPNVSGILRSPDEGLAPVTVAFPSEIEYDHSIPPMVSVSALDELGTKMRKEVNRKRILMRIVGVCMENFCCGWNSLSGMVLPRNVLH